MMAYQLNGAKNHQDLSASHTGSSSGTDITAAKLSLDGVISRIDGEQDHGGSTAGTVLQSYSYLGLGTIVQEVDSNGMELTYIHQSGDTLSGSDGGDRYTGLDRFGRVVDQWWYDPSTSTTLERLQYGYDPDGNVLYINNLITSSQSELFHANSSTSGDDATAYDGLNRLTNFARGTLSASSNNGSTLDTVASPSTTQSWSLDAIGNWTADTGGANGSETRTSNADNEITSSNGTTNESPTYDHNGNMTYDGVNNTYVYDAWNRIVSMKQGATALENRTYYADRAMGASSDTCEGVITHMYYSSDWQVIEEQTYSGGAGYVVSAQYVWGQGYTDQMVERDDNSTSGSLGLSGSGLGRRIFAVQDVNHDVTALADLNAVVLVRFTYGPYGNGFNGTPYGWLYQFQGGRIDPVTGLYNFRNRDYNAGFGVWMEQDPTGYRSGSDVYAFDADSPADLDDPFGLAPNRGPIMASADPYVQVEPDLTVKRVNRRLTNGKEDSIGETRIIELNFKYPGTSLDDLAKTIVLAGGPTDGAGVVPGTNYFELGGVKLKLTMEIDIATENVDAPAPHGWAAAKGRGWRYVLLHEEMHVNQVINAITKEKQKLRIPITTPPDASKNGPPQAERYFRYYVQHNILPQLNQAAHSATVMVHDQAFWDALEEEWNREDYGGSSFS